MAEETESDEIVSMGLGITWRELGTTPTAMLHVPLGGPEPAVVIGFNFNTPGQMGVEMQVSGLPDDKTLVQLLHAIAEHMETMPSTRMSDEGVEYKEPLGKAEDT